MDLIDTTLLLEILRQLCFGSLISGILIFLLTLFLQGSHLFDHDTDLDHDVSIDHDLSLDHDASLDHGFSLDKDISLDHDASLDVDVDVDIDVDLDFDVDHDSGVGLDKNLDKDHGAGASAPLMLLLGTFMITFGISGMVLLETSLNPIILILTIFGLPFISTFIVSKIWEKLAVGDIYETALETIRIDDTVLTLTTVDEKGGLVVIETSSIHGPTKMAAKTKHGAIARGMKGYVIEIQGNTLIIDEWTSKEGEEKPIPEGSIKWE